MSGPVTRRLKRVMVPEHMVFDLILARGDKMPQYIDVPMLEVPKGSKTHSVIHDPMSRSFLFLVEHESFEEVPDGGYIPQAGFGLMTETVKLDENYGEDGYEYAGEWKNWRPIIGAGKTRYPDNDSVYAPSFEATNPVVVLG